jgi:hypothetical protein
MAKFQRGGFAKAPYSNNRSNNTNRTYKKRSGATIGVTRNGDNQGKPYVTGWCLINKQLVKFLCTPYKKTGDHKNGKGETIENWMVKVQPSLGAGYITSGIYYQGSRKVRIPSMNIVINPSVRFCGKSQRPKSQY